MVKRKWLAVIPARGGSKRIKGKNIVDFFGRPMIALTIEAAQQSGLFERIIVSTDDKDIASAAEKYGVEVPFLRNDKADDYSPVSEATIAALRQAEEYFGESYGCVAQLMANCPLRTASDIKEAVRNFENNNVEFQVSCFKFGWMNPWWAVKLMPDGTPEQLFPEAGNKRSQDLEDLYCPTGAVWLARRQSLVSANTFYGQGYKMFPIDWRSAVDIDNYEDLEMAKLLYKMRGNRG